jgi:fluoride exporter
VNGLLAVAAGGVVGAVARHLVYLTTGHLLGHGFPYATLIVNVIGSFAMGPPVEAMALAWSTSTEMRLFLPTGVPGAVTTFSAFSPDFAVLSSAGPSRICGLYTVASFVLSVGVLFAGLYFMRRSSRALTGGRPHRSLHRRKES